MDILNTYTTTYSCNLFQSVLLYGRRLLGRGRSEDNGHNNNHMSRHIRCRPNIRFLDGVYPVYDDTFH